MKELTDNRITYFAFFIAVFLSLVSTPLYFDPTQVSNQAIIDLGYINIPLQILPILGILLYFTGITATWNILWILATLFIFLAISLPEIPNHRYILLITTCYLTYNLLIKDKGKELDRLASFSRIFISIIYLFSFFAKLNTSFINPEISCASIFYENVRSSNISILPSSTFVHLTSIYLSIIFEGLAALLILSKRFRIFIVLAGLLFHLGLSFDLIKYFTNFSSIMYFLLFFSLGDVAMKPLYEVMSQLNRHLIFRKTLQSFLFLITLSCLLSGEIMFPYHEASLGILILSRHILWLCIAFFTLYVLIRTLKNRAKSNTGNASIGILPSLILFLYFINCLGPYLGYKTRGVLSMYSNLRIEKDFSNHLLIKESLNLFNTISDVVRVSKVNHQCTSILTEGLTYPLQEIKRVEKKCPGEVLVVEMDNKTFISSDPEWVEMTSVSPPFPFSLLLFFGPVGEGADKECVW